MKRISVTPKIKIEDNFAFGEIGSGEEIRKYIFNTVLQESINYDFIESFFRIELKPNQEDKIEKEVILHGYTNISFKPRYRPQIRFKKNGPIKSYEGFEYKKEFIRIETFMQLFDIEETN